MDAMLIVGTSKETMKESIKSIMMIINSKNSDPVKHDALDCLKNICHVNGTTISDCTFTTKDK